MFPFSPDSTPFRRRLGPVLAMLLASAWPATAEIRINEVQSTNTGLPDPAGQLIDWVEIHNTAAAPVNLQGHYLSDSLSSRLKYQFPDVTLPAGGFLIIWAGSLGDFPNNRTPFHANFSISSGGEPVVLTAPDGTTIIDEYPALAIGTSNGTGRSMGRQPDGTGPLFFFNTPTQGAANTTAGVATETLAAPAFSVPGGPHTSSVSVSISTSVVGGTIRYTLDGSDPTESSPVYSGPLTLSSRTGEANLYAEIPTNYLDPGPPYYEGWQPPNGEVFKINVLRARVFKPNVAPSRITTQSYLVDPAGAARYPYPVVSIATTAANLFSDETGIYVPGRPDAWPKNYAQEGSAWERPGHIEFYEPDGTLGFQGEIGIRLHGNTTVSRPRKALRIYARNPAGPSTFNHQIFAEKEVDSFDTFLLRAGGNDWGQSIFRDALVSAIAAPTGLDRMSSRPAAVFIDGEYWGIHNVRDRIDEGYYFHHYGLTDAEFTQLEVPASAAGSWPVYDRGEPSLLADFEDILDRAWAGEFATPQGYAALTARIDIDNFIDYQVHEIWAGNTDWPGNNVRLWRAVTPDTQPGAHARHDGKWRWILFDADFALGLDFFYVPGFSDGPNHNTLAYASLTGGANFIGNSEQGTRLLRKTLENSEFRDKFINRFADLLNTSLSVSNATAKLDEFVSLYAPGMTEHVNRWRQPFNWTNDIGRIRNYLQQRPAAVRGHIAGRFGLPGMANLTVGVSDTNRGTITVNSIPLVPSTVGVSSNPYPWTGTYFQSVPVTVAANPKPGYRFVSWTDSGATNTNAVVNLATDSTANYASAWTNNTPNGGSGFNSWIFADTPSFDDGFFIGTSGRAIHASSPDGRSFGIYGHSGGSASASRGFAAGALQTNQSFSVTLSPGGFSGTKGVAVGAAGTNYFSFYAASFSGSPRYYVRDGTNGQVRLDALFSPEANKTFNFSATRLSNNVHRIVISSGSTTFVTNANLGGTIDRAVFFHTNSASSSDTNNLYFNQPRITQPGTNNGGVVQLFDPVVEVSLTTARTLTAEFEPEPASALALGGAASWTLGFTNAPLEVRAVNLLGDTDVNFTGTITLTIAGPGGFNQSFSATALEGVATFAAVDLPAGSYTLTATSGSLATGAPAAFLVKDAAVFLPTVTASWHVATNWDIASVPNSAAARVLIPANALTNRDVTLSAPATVASLGFDQGGSAFRNRVNGAAGSPLTFQATNGPATINVGGIGAGHANIEVSGGAVLLSDTVLDVQNISSTNAEYGALRLQGNWSGAGRMIKRGPGMAGITGAGKTFSGDIIIEQGVLTFSEPALTGNSVTSYTVQAGGQLRLSSAGAPRNYLLQGPLNLAGSGRSGVPEDENLGVLGALRLETGGTGTIAVLTNPVHLSSSADIHAPAGNAIQLQGPLTGSSLLTKSGGGTLTLDAGASVFGGGLAVNRGAVVLNGASITNTNTLSLAPETSLGGQGRWGGLLEVQGGGTLAFALGTSPSPAPPLRAGSLVVSGPAGVSLNVATNTLAGNYPLLAVDGSLVGTNNLALTAVPPAFPASRLVFSNQTLYVDLRASLGEREEWLEFHGLPVDGSGDGADDADPDRDGLDNVIERAFFLSPVLADGSLPVSTAHPSTDAVVVTYRVAKNQGDLTVTPETRPDLQPGAAWNAATPMVVDDTHPDYTVYQVELPAGPGAGFLRFRVTRL